MTSRNEYLFAETKVDRLFLESFANEKSAYFVGVDELTKAISFDKFRNRLKWHIQRSLSSRQKQVINYYLKGKTEREIAALLGVTQQVVNIYKHRAIRKLHKLIMA